MPVAFSQANYQVQTMFARQFAKVFRGRPWDRFGSATIIQAVHRESFRQNNQVRFLPSCLLYQWCELTATFEGCFSSLWPVMDRGQSHFSGRGWLALAERDFAPFNRPSPFRPAQI